MQELGESRGHLAGPLVALFGVALQGLARHGGELAVDFFVELVGRSEFALADEGQGLLGRVSIEGALVGEHFEQTYAQGENIRAFIHARAGKLFRAHVVDFAFDDAGLGGGNAAGGPGDAEVHDFDLAFKGDQHVLRADVPVHDVQHFAVCVQFSVGVV